MNMNNKSCWGAMIYAFLSGTLLGAGLALLFTPVSGKEVRSAIAHEFDELKEKMKKMEEKISNSSGIIDSEASYEDFM